MRILVVGGVAAGMSAASRARRHDPHARITVLERSDWISYGACGLPYVLSRDTRGDPGDFGVLVARTPEQMQDQGIDVHLRHDVTGVDAAARTVRVHDRDTGRTRTEPYDQLLLATGVHAARPDWAARDVAGVHVLRDIPDGQAIEADLQRGARRAVIVGGGYIGLEVAESLTRRSLHVTLLEHAGQVAGRALDPAYRDLVGQTLRDAGVDLRTGTQVQGLHTRAGRVTGIETQDGPVNADLVIVAVGVRPSTDLARAAGVRLGRSGAVSVDARQRTNVDGIWAAGDVCEVTHRVTRRRVHLPLGLAANRMGRVAGVNMVGGDARFPGVVGTAIFRVFDRSVARTGLTQDEADAAGLDAVSVDLSSRDHAGYMRDAHDLHVRLTAERGSGRLLGAQFVGVGDAVKRVDVIAALLHSRGRVHNLAEMDLAYAPPFSSVWDVLLVAAGRLGKAVREGQTGRPPPHPGA